MSINKEIEAHDYPINFCRAALNDANRHAEATEMAVTVCEQIQNFTGLPINEVFDFVAQAIDRKDSAHTVLENARAALGLSGMHLVAA